MEFTYCNSGLPIAFYPTWLKLIINKYQQGCYIKFYYTFALQKII